MNRGRRGRDGSEQLELPDQVAIRRSGTDPLLRAIQSMLEIKMHVRPCSSTEFSIRKTIFREKRTLKEPAGKVPEMPALRRLRLCCSTLRVDQVLGCGFLRIN